MGSLTLQPNQIAAFNSEIFPNGLDLGRCVVSHDLGIWNADPAATFLQGSLVMKGANGITQTDGSTSVIGIAKWNKASTIYGANVDEPVTLVGVVASSLKKAYVSNVKVSSAPNGTGSNYTATTDYTVNATNGTVTRNASGAIPSGATVYVTYTFALQSADLDFQGRNFWNFLDDVTIQAGAVTVITGWSIIFTTQYDTSQTYTLGQQLYAGASGGLFTNQAGTITVGTVLQVPTATDQFLGVVKPY